MEPCLSFQWTQWARAWKGLGGLGSRSSRSGAQRVAGFSGTRRPDGSKMLHLLVNVQESEDTASKSAPIITIIVVLLIELYIKCRFQNPDWTEQKADGGPLVSYC